MGSAGKAVKSVVKPVASAVTLGMSDSLMGGGLPSVPKVKAPEPVAPATKSSENVQQAKDYNRSKLASMQGRKQSSILNPADALADEEKDILG